MPPAQPVFKSRKAWFKWYSSVYLKCYHWRYVVRPAVYKYRKGVCCFCSKKIVGNLWHCHHGEGMYKHLGEEHKHLDRMEVAHAKCHTSHTRKTRRKSVARRVRKAILGI